MNDRTPDAFTVWGNFNKDQKKDDCVKLRANLMPRQSQAGNDYLLMALSDAKPKVDKSDVPF